MKKHLLINLLLLISTGVAYSYEVPKSVQKKNILLEEFTGIYCGNCPGGHKIANILSTAQPESTYIIAVHSGNYAKPLGNDPDYRTDEGESLDAELEAPTMGYPCGSVNRHTFEGSSVLLSRSEWIKNAKQIHSEDAPVNLWIKSDYDGSTRSLKVRVEGYYTSEIQSPEQFLNIAWTQSNIHGYQNGGSLGNEYIHQHMLRGYITPLWGEQLTKPQNGVYFEKEYIYQLPEDVRGVPVKAEDIDVVAFVTSGRREVLNVIGGKPFYSNYEKPLAAVLSAPKMAIGARYGYNFFEAVLKNNSDKAITEASFEVIVNGELQTVRWSGNIPSFASMPIILKVSPYTFENNNKYTITLLSVNGQSVDTSSLEGDFAAPLESTPTISITLQTDLYADENRFLLKDADGEIVKEFGPYEVGKKTVYQETVQLEPNKLYSFEILDAWGDGMQEPKGYLKMYTDSKKLVEQNYDIQLYGSRSFFSTSLAPSAIVENYSENNYILDIQNKLIRLSNATKSCNISIYSMEGKCLMQSNQPTMSIDQIPAGVYLLKVCQDGKNDLSKIIIY